MNVEGKECIGRGQVSLRRTEAEQLTFRLFKNFAYFTVRKEANSAANSEVLSSNLVVVV